MFIPLEEVQDTIDNYGKNKNRPDPKKIIGRDIYMEIEGVKSLGTVTDYIRTINLFQVEFEYDNRIYYLELDVIMSNMAKKEVFSRVQQLSRLRQDLAHLTNTTTNDYPSITVSAGINANQRMPLANPSNQQPNPCQQSLLTLIGPDSHSLNQSLPNNNHSNNSITLSPLLSDALKHIPPHNFSFTASNEPHPKQTANPLTRTVKTNPTPKITRTGPTRPGTKHDPNRPTPDPTQKLPVPMDVQIEKKRRRENEKEKEDVSTVTQHFLTAGPGSQACRDQ
ncbi:hypothetical protein P8452_43009 [Trifolium repens]|nr:hypothetical protein P8452_43009 [Trifolium repens]